MSRRDVTAMGMYIAMAPNPQDDRSTSVTRTVGTAISWFGSVPAILAACGLVVVWALGALIVPGGFSNNAYLISMDTVTSLVTFVMVFVIQNSQNRDGRALQAKVDAQSTILQHVAEKLGIDHQEMLTELVGVEDAPEHAIKEHQDSVRRSISASRPH